jgi:hypothetical protein
MTGRSRAAEALIGIHPKRHLARMEGILALFDIHWAVSPPLVAGQASAETAKRASRLPPRNFAATQKILECLLL